MTTQTTTTAQETAEQQEQAIHALEAKLETAQGQTGQGLNAPIILPQKTSAPFRLKVRFGVLLALLAGGLAVRLLTHSEWNMILVPILAGVAVAFTWSLIELLFFARRPHRYTKSFLRPIYYAMLLPLWSIACYVLYALPTDATRWNEGLIDALTALLIAMFLFCAPVAAALLGILAISFGVKHWKSTPQGDSIFYREGPLVLAGLLCATVFALCVFGVFVLL